MAVIGIALGVGAIVYAVSLRGGDETLTLDRPQPAPTRPHSERRPRPERRGRAVGFELPTTPPTATAQEPSESFVYIPVLESSHVSWQRRLAGVVGLIVLVTAAAALLAGAVYEAGHVINDTIARFLGG